MNDQLIEVKLPQAGEQTFSIISLLAQTNQMVDHMGTLHQWDHTGEPSRQISGDPDAALDGLATIRSFLETFIDRLPTEKQPGARDLIRDIQATTTGFLYRREHKLPAIGTQVGDIRKKLYGNDVSAAGNMLQVLSDQPDALAYVDQLKREYSDINNLLESGQLPDVNAVYTQVFHVTSGLDFADIRECASRARQLDQLAKNIDALGQLAKMQGAQGILQIAADAVPEQKERIIDRVTHELAFRESLITNQPLYEIKNIRTERPDATDIEVIVYAQERYAKAIGLPDNAGDRALRIHDATENVNRSNAHAMLLNIAKGKIAVSVAEKRFRNQLSRILKMNPGKDETRAREELSLATQRRDQVNTDAKLVWDLSYYFEANEMVAALKEIDGTADIVSK